jgi:hypothetical protein
MEIELTPIIQTVLTTILTALAAAIAKLILAKADELLASKNEDERYFIRETIRSLTQAAQQIYKAGNGNQKKAYVISQAEKALHAKGIKIDLDQIEAEIEAAVWSQFSPNEPLTEPKG